MNLPPYFLSETPGALNTRLSPFDIPLRRSVRQHEPACRFCAILFDDGFGVDYVLLGLGHLLDAAGQEHFAGPRADPLPAFRNGFGRQDPLPLRSTESLVNDHALR